MHIGIHVAIVITVEQYALWIQYVIIAGIDSEMM